MSATQKRVLLVVRCVGIAFVTGMGVWLMVGAVHNRSLERPIHGGLTTTGSVVSFTTSAGTSSDYYRPLVRFQDRSGHTYTVTGVSTSTRPEIGDTATISYNPSKPGAGHDLSDTGYVWQWPFFTGLSIVVIGLLVAVLIAVVLVRRRRLGIVIDAPPSAATGTRGLRVAARTQTAMTVPLAAAVYFAASDGNSDPARGVIGAVLFLVISVVFQVQLWRKARQQSTVSPDRP